MEWSCTPKGRTPNGEARVMPLPRLAAALLVGCTAAVPLPEVPIIGGTQVERDIARSVMLAFDEDVGPGRVDLESLTFGDPGEGAWGRLRGDRIMVLPGLDED